MIPLLAALVASSLAVASDPAGATPVTSTSRQAEPGFDDLSKRAAEARDAGRLDEAVALYAAALRSAPRWAEGWWYLGTIFYDKDRYPEARDAFRSLAVLQPDNARYWAFLGLCEYQTQEFDPSLPDLRKALALGIDDEPQLGDATRYHAAILMNRSEQFEIAFQTLIRLARQGNESPSVLAAYGLSLLRMSYLPSEVPADKQEVLMLAGRAGYAWGARRGQEARAAFGELIARYPRAPNVHYAFGVFLLDDDADAALAEFGKELDLSPSHVPALIQCALERIKRGEYAAGLPFATKAEALAPRNFITRNALGRILIETGDIPRAIEQLEAGVQLAPDSPETHFALARAYARADRPSDAAREREVFKKLEEARTRAAQAAAGVEPPRP